MDQVPVNKELLTGTVPVNKELLTGKVPVNKELLTGTIPVNNSIHILFAGVLVRLVKYWLVKYWGGGPLSPPWEKP